MGHRMYEAFTHAGACRSQDATEKSVSFKEQLQLQQVFNRNYDLPESVPVTTI